MAQDLMSAFGVGKPKPGMPPSLRSNRTGAPPAASPAPEPATPDMGMDAEGEDGKAPPDEAGFVTADQRCGDCTHWHPDSGDCDEVEGTTKACDGCRVYFEAKGGGLEAEPDGDEGSLTEALKGRTPGDDIRPTSI